MFLLQIEPLWVEGAGHNDVEIYSQYVERLKRFINFEIVNYQTKIMGASSNKENFDVKTANESILKDEPELQNEPCLDKNNKILN